MLSNRRTCKSLVSFISQRVPELAVPASIIATATPDKASVALEILAEHPTVALDGEAALAPLLANESALLRKLVMDDKLESCRLVDALRGKNVAVQAAVASPEMLVAVLRAPQAKVARFLEAHGAMPSPKVSQR